MLHKDTKGIATLSRSRPSTACTLFRPPRWAISPCALPVLMLDQIIDSRTQVERESNLLLTRAKTALETTVAGLERNLQLERYALLVPQDEAGNDVKFYIIITSLTSYVCFIFYRHQ